MSFQLEHGHSLRCGGCGNIMTVGHLDFDEIVCFGSGGCGADIELTGERNNGVNEARLSVKSCWTTTGRPVAVRAVNPETGQAICFEVVPAVGADGEDLGWSVWVSDEQGALSHTHVRWSHVRGASK